MAVMNPIGKGERRWAMIVGIVMLTAVFWPLGWEKGHDSYPLSPYPMFTTNRTQVTIDKMLIVDDEGKRHKIDPQLLGTDEVMQASQSIRRSVRGGKKTMRLLCKEVAAAIRARGDSNSYVRVELRSERYNSVDYFLKGPKPIRSKLRMKCKVRRGEA